MSSSRAPNQPSLFEVVTAAPDPDTAARQFAVDPLNNVVLEASAGTGKTSVLVARYVNLLKAGVDPSNILAITFTRKASAEMRERILHELRAAAARSEIDRARWVDLRDRLGDIAISTIDAFCLSLLREFPLEADLDPGFSMADETEVPRLIATSLDRQSDGQEARFMPPVPLTVDPPPTGPALHTECFVAPAPITPPAKAPETPVFQRIVGGERQMEADSLEQQEDPTVMRAANQPEEPAIATLTVQPVSSESEDLDLMDIPAFLRRHS